MKLTRDPSLNAWIDEEGRLCLSFGEQGEEPALKLVPSETEELKVFIEYWAGECRRQHGAIEAQNLKGLSRLLHPGTAFLVPRGLILFVALATSLATPIGIHIIFAPRPPKEPWPVLISAALAGGLSIATMTVTFFALSALLVRRRP